MSARYGRYAEECEVRIPRTSVFTLSIVSVLYLYLQAWKCLLDWRMGFFASFSIVLAVSDID